MWKPVHWQTELLRFTHRPFIYTLCLLSLGLSERNWLFRMLVRIVELADWFFFFHPLEYMASSLHWKDYLQGHKGVCNGVLRSQINWEHWTSLLGSFNKWECEINPKRNQKKNIGKWARNSCFFSTVFYKMLAWISQAQGGNISYQHKQTWDQVNVNLF